MTSPSKRRPLKTTQLFPGKVIQLALEDPLPLMQSFPKNSDQCPHSRPTDPWLNICVILEERYGETLESCYCSHTGDRCRLYAKLD